MIENRQFGQCFLRLSEDLCSTSRAIFRVELRPGSTLFADGRISGAHYCQRLFGIASLEGQIIDVGDLPRLPIEFQLTQCVERRTLRTSLNSTRPRRRRQLCAKKRVQYVAKRCYCQSGTDYKSGHLSRLTAASIASSSRSVASTGFVVTTAGVGVRAFHLLIRALTITAPAPSATKGIV